MILHDIAVRNNTFQLNEVHMCFNHIIKSYREPLALASCSLPLIPDLKTPHVQKLPQLQYYVFYCS